MNRVLFGLSNLIFYNRFRLDPKVGLKEILVSFPMKAGRIIDALNQLAEQAGQIMWAAYARPRDNHDGWNVCQTPGSCHAVLQFDLRDEQYVSALIATQPWTKNE